MNDSRQIDRLEAGTPLVYGGNRVTHVTAELAQAFGPGDRVIVVESTGDVLHIPAEEHAIAEAAVTRAVNAFGQMGAVSDDAVSAFFETFARRLEAEASWAPIAAANELDVARARERGRSTTRLAASDKMRGDMIAGLRAWRDAPSRRGAVLETVQHEGWLVEQRTAPLGVVAFVFEGRPNVFADATGVLRGGNTVVFRIGSDALNTARAMVEYALDPALAQAGLPAGAASLVASASHAAGWALFSDPRLALAVARGSGPAVAQLGCLARQAGNQVSLHGTGGAWLIVDESAPAEHVALAVQHSLDRKVCNTLNVCCLPQNRVKDLAPAVLSALQAAGDKRGHGFKLHVVEGDEDAVPAELFSTPVKVARAEGAVEEPQAETLPEAGLAHEWEWEETPEITLKVTDSAESAVALFNQYSPQFVLSLMTGSSQRWEQLYELANAPFVGNGFTRWVDGQYALSRPELGLSNWETGRLFARGGILSGDGVYAVRTVARQQDPDIHR